MQNIHLELKTIEDVYKLIKSYFQQYQNQHNKPTKISDQKARKALNEIRLLIPIYKKLSLQKTK